MRAFRLVQHSTSRRSPTSQYVDRAIRDVNPRHAPMHGTVSRRCYAYGCDHTRFCARPPKACDIRSRSASACDGAASNQHTLALTLAHGTRAAVHAAQCCRLTSTRQSRDQGTRTALIRECRKFSNTSPHTHARAKPPGGPLRRAPRGSSTNATLSPIARHHLAAPSPQLHAPSLQQQPVARVPSRRQAPKVALQQCRARPAQLLVVVPSSDSAPICSQSPSRLSFHSVTWLSPPDTARMLPVTDQLTRHTAHEKVITL